MDKLTAWPYAIGQPLRPEDWQLIQEATKVALADIIKGLSSEASIILWGLNKTVNAGVVHVTEGAIYTDGEVFYVPAAEFNTGEEWDLYLQANFTTEESRSFKDTSQRDVWQRRRFEVGITLTGTYPPGALIFDDLRLLSDLQSEAILLNIDTLTKLVNRASFEYLTGFRPGTSFDYGKIVGNGLNQYMIIAAFYATNVSGQLGTLPLAYRPDGDLTGHFWASGFATGIITIKKNGEIWLFNCSVDAVNYITFQFPLRFDDPVGYDTPTGKDAE